jgi:hypothetical protein
MVSHDAAMRGARLYAARMHVRGHPGAPRHAARLPHRATALTPPVNSCRPPRTMRAKQRLGDGTNQQCQ